MSNRSQEMRRRMQEEDWEYAHAELDDESDSLWERKAVKDGVWNNGMHVYAPIALQLTGDISGPTVIHLLPDGTYFFEDPSG